LLCGASTWAAPGQLAVTQQDCAAIATTSKAAIKKAFFMFFGFNEEQKY
jgi:hypothetical protein